MCQSFYRSDQTEFHPRQAEPTIYTTGPPAVIAANLIAAHLVNVVGPFSWAALIVLYVLAQISPN
jgi:hypothetical protein